MKKVMWWADFAWRLPLALLIRAPIMLLGMGLTKAGDAIFALGSYVPGIPHMPRRAS